MRLPCGLEDLFLPLKTSWEQCASLLMTFLEMEKAGILRNFLDLTARWESLSCDLQREQTETGIRKRINDEEFLRLKHYTNLYREKFGFTFVICARLHDTKDSVLEKVLERLKNNENQELETGIEEVKKIMILRMKDLVDDCQTSKL